MILQNQESLEQYVERISQFAAMDRKLQMLLASQYRAPISHKPDVRDFEYRSFSQNGEDGILLYLFSRLGMTSRRAVEICCGTGIESNSANLIINYGWSGLLFDGNAENIEWGIRVFARLADTLVRPPHLVHSWITAENVNVEIARQGWSGEIDLLSIDVDGNDYWIWKAIDSIQPRVVVIEFSAFWGPDRAVTIPYSADFRWDRRNPSYCGASLAAMVKLGHEKGYRFIGTNRSEINAFFVRTDLAASFPSPPLADYLHHWQAWSNYDWGRRVWLDV
jgi:hypothetical protein